MSAHARLSPSAAERWFECPGAPNAEKDLPDRPTEAASIGTTAHAVLEASIRAGKEPEDAAFHIMLTDDEMMRRITGVYHRVMKLAEETDAVIYSERRVTAGKCIDRSDLWGTCDLILDAGDHVYVIDLKYGTHRVKAKHNKQLLIYALGALTSLKLTPKRITIMIEQPRVLGFPDVWTLTIEELEAFKTELDQRAKATDDPNAPRVPGQHCFFCRAWSTCDTRNNTRIKNAFTRVDIPVEFD